MSNFISNLSEIFTISVVKIKSKNYGKTNITIIYNFIKNFGNIKIKEIFLGIWKKIFCFELQKNFQNFKQFSKKIILDF